MLQILAIIVVILSFVKPSSIVSKKVKAQGHEAVAKTVMKLRIVFIILALVSFLPLLLKLV